MKPEQFIREQGLERARHVLSGLPNYYTHMTDDARMFISEHNKKLDENIRKQLPSLMRLEDLKRLVESVDLIRAYGSARAIESLFHVDDMGMAKIMRVDDLYWHDAKQAIRDYESIYGGGDE